MKKLALITGANKGLGLETARQLGKQGIHILIGARNEEQGTRAATQLQSEGIEASFQLLDVNDEGSIKAAAKAVTSQYGKLDILINNAGVNPEYPAGVLDIESLTTDMLLSIHKTNFIGPFIAIREFMPLLKKSEAGRIVNVSSSIGSLTEQSNPTSPYYGVNTLAYNTSKTALNSLTVQVAKQVANTNIKVNSICPGWVKTDMGSEYAPKTVEQGVSVIVDLASASTNGGFYDENGHVAW
jgi:NAD(P)-dependent dehydrogenase (short-subunit alcohol dehydrogenase family)